MRPVAHAHAPTRVLSHVDVGGVGARLRGQSRYAVSILEGPAARIFLLQSNKSGKALHTTIEGTATLYVLGESIAL